MAAAARTAAPPDHRRRLRLRRAGAASAALAAAGLCSVVVVLRAPPSDRPFAGGGSPFDVDAVVREQLSPEEEEAEAEGRMHRLLASLGDAALDVDGSPVGGVGDDGFAAPDWLTHAGEEGRVGAEEALAARENSLPPRPSSPAPLAPYDVVDAVGAARLFDTSYAVVVYDNLHDKFEFLYTRNQRWSSSGPKLMTSYKILTSLLRREFPGRFCGPACPELAIGISSGDYPHVRPGCLANFPRAAPGCDAGNAPILQFGSVFRSPEIAPTMIAMPVPASSSLHCFKDWGAKRRVCHQLTPKGVGRGRLVFGENPDGGIPKWDDLKPQVIWRGSDFNYLGRTRGRRESYTNGLGIPMYVPPSESGRGSAAPTEGATLLPRWRGVMLTDEARREAEGAVDGGGEKMPWADMRFVTDRKRGPKQLHLDLAEEGIQAVGDPLSSEEMAGYRYHIDIGGGGGTTWTGTTQKLALPGLLFHHVTPTKDRIHDHMTPWVHYVPVRSDLSDLREKYDWAESHPSAAEAISRRGSELMRRIGSKEGFAELFCTDFVEPLRRVIDAYVPVATSHPGMTWREVLENADGLPGIAFKDNEAWRPGKAGAF